MAYDEALAARVREILSSRSNVSEKMLFGGITFAINGNMVCSISSQGFVLSVGKDRFDEAMQLPNMKQRMLGPKAMPGMVVGEDAASWSDEDLANAVNLAADVAAAKPPKEAKAPKKAKMPEQDMDMAA